MKKPLILISMLLTLAGVLTFNSCGEDEEAAFELETLLAGSSDLNGVFAPTDVAVDAVITATFSVEIDPASATSTTVTLVRDYDETSMEINVSASGNTITVDATENFGNGTKYILTLTTGVKTKGGTPLAANIERSFTTTGSFTVAGAIAHWTFEDNANDVVGTFDPAPADVINITYTTGRNTAAGKAATFDGDASIIEIPNGDDLMDTEDFTLSLWVKTNSNGHVNADGNPTGHFVIGLGAFFGFQLEIFANSTGFKMPVQFDYGDGTTGTGGDLVYNGNGQTKDNGGWQGTTFNKEQDVSLKLKDLWANIVYVYNSETKERSFFLNGERVVTQDHNLWPAGSKELGIVGLKFADNTDVENKLAFGFVQSRGGTLWDSEPWGGYDFTTSQHFKGQLDDVMIFHKVLTEAEIELIYESGK